MSVDRREFLAFAVGGVAYALSPGLVRAAQPSEIKVLAFDALAIFDPRPIAALTEKLFPGRGPAMTNAWRTRQFEYQWLRALAGRYADFLQTTEESLLFAARQLQVELSSDAREQLMRAWSNLAVWPDVPDGIDRLRRAGIRLALVSNMTAAVLNDGLERAGLGHGFEAVLSTDAIRSYKPNPLAYRMAMDKLGLKKEEILFVPFAGWDVAGAKWFGYRTFWLNRQHGAPEPVSAEADAMGPDFDFLIQYALRSKGGIG